MRFLNSRLNQTSFTVLYPEKLNSVLKQILIFVFFNQTIFAAELPYFSINSDFHKIFQHIEKAELNLADSLLKKKGYAKSKNTAFFILENYTNTLKYLLYQTDDSFYNYLKKCQENLIELNRYKNTSDAKYIKSILYFQSGIVNFLRGEKMDAMTKMHSSYRFLVSIDKNQPNYGLHKELLGVFHVVFGYMPNSYIKMAKLIGIKADIKLGLQEISFVAKSNYYNKHEASLIKSGLQIFSNEKVDSTYESNAINVPQKVLYIYAEILLLQKQHKAKKALEIFAKNFDAKVEIPLLYYTKGNLLLYKSDFKNAEKCFNTFLEEYQGLNYIKDAYFKKALCRRLIGDSIGYLTVFSESENKGIANLEADKKAQKALSSKELQHIDLARTMLFMDGGYYKEAIEQLQKVKYSSLISLRDKVEYYYRTARVNEALFHKSLAEKYYLKCIQLQGDEPYYFAPNSYLQLGNMYKKTDKNKAIWYFKNVLPYKNHEYKNSLDNKAKSALKMLHVE